MNLFGHLKGFVVGISIGFVCGISVTSYHMNKFDEMVTNERITLERQIKQRRLNDIQQQYKECIRRIDEKKQVGENSCTIPQYDDVLPHLIRDGYTIQAVQRTRYIKSDHPSGNCSGGLSQLVSFGEAIPLRIFNIPIDSIKVEWETP